MKNFKAWIILDEDGEPFIAEERAHIFWLKEQAIIFIQNYKVEHYTKLKLKRIVVLEL